MFLLSNAQTIREDRYIRAELLRLKSLQFHAVAVLIAVKTAAENARPLHLTAPGARLRSLHADRQRVQPGADGDNSKNSGSGLEILHFGSDLSMIIIENFAFQDLTPYHIGKFCFFTFPLIYSLLFLQSTALNVSNKRSRQPTF